jgi:hypothetical protein
VPLRRHQGSPLPMFFVKPTPLTIIEVIQRRGQPSLAQV